MGSLDKQAKSWLLKWATDTTIWSERWDMHWLRAQPVRPNERVRAPRLTGPGSEMFSVQPDGLWITLGIPSGDTTTKASYADCVVVEACGTSQNLHDKRARYAARTTSLVIDLRQAWLKQVDPWKGGALRSRRDALGGLLPTEGIVLLPIRHLRVIYALPKTGPRSLYDDARQNMVMEAHEFILPFNKLGQYNGQQTQDFLKRIGPHLQYMV